MDSEMFNQLTDVVTAHALEPEHAWLAVKKKKEKIPSTCSSWNPKQATPLNSKNSESIGVFLIWRS